MKALVINSGSSSVKFELFEFDSAEGTSLIAGEVERIGSTDATLRMSVRARGDANDTRHGVEANDHEQALRVAFDAITDLASGPQGGSLAGEPAVVGHRIVHGGARFIEPVLIDDSVIEGIESVALLAPLHTRANLAGVRAARALIPDVPHVAIFDTAFHRTLPPRAYTYALPRELAAAHNIRKYGFHGTSHEYVAERAAAMLRRPIDGLDLITLHLGNGASVSAIHHGMSIDTSMGMTPLEGLVMGTRSGDVDPTIPMLLGELTGRTREEINALLNSQSGLLGLCGSSDMREVHARAAEGDEHAELALEIFCYRAKKYVGAYFAVLGRLDALVFTAGIGENDADVRARICEGLECLGIEIDETANNEETTVERSVSVASSEVTVLVIPTDEEREIARAALECVGAR